MRTKELKIAGSKIMPSITFQNGTLSIVGRCVPQNSNEFFEPVMKALNDYAHSPAECTVIIIRLEYLNSDSNRAIMNLLIAAEKLHQKGKKVEIHWYYANNDESMIDQGNIFKSLISVPFDLESVN